MTINNIPCARPNRISTPLWTCTATVNFKSFMTKFHGEIFFRSHTASDELEKRCGRGSFLCDLIEGMCNAAAYNGCGLSYRMAAGIWKGKKKDCRSLEGQSPLRKHPPVQDFVPLPLYLESALPPVPAPTYFQYYRLHCICHSRSSLSFFFLFHIPAATLYYHNQYL